MRIIQTIHAKERMEQRGIERQHIEEALKSPTCSLPTKNKIVKRIMKKFKSGRALDIFYIPRGKNTIVLVSAVWLNKEDRKVDS